MRDGTRKSRAPSGDEAVRIGVWNSKKPCSLHAAAHRIDDRAARHDVLMQLVAAQIEEAVFQPDVFGIFLLAKHRQRQFTGRAKHLDLA